MTNLIKKKVIAAIFAVLIVLSANLMTISVKAQDENLPHGGQGLGFHRTCDDSSRRHS